MPRLLYAEPSKAFRSPAPQNMVSGTVVSSYDQAVNSIGQRSAIGQTGTAIGSGRLIALGYSSDVRKHGAANRLTRITAPVI